MSDDIRARVERRKREIIDAAIEKLAQVEAAGELNGFVESLAQDSARSELRPLKQQEALPGLARKKIPYRQTAPSWVSLAVAGRQPDRPPLLPGSMLANCRDAVYEFVGTGHRTRRDISAMLHERYPEKTPSTLSGSLSILIARGYLAVVKSEHRVGDTWRA